MIQHESQDASQNSLSDTVKSILEAHFERFTEGFIDRCINDWSNSGKNISGLRNAHTFIYKFANLNREEFKEFLKEKIDRLDGKRLSQETRLGLEELRIGLDSCSKHCNGDIDGDDPMWKQCRVVSDMEDDALKQVIGGYFKYRVNAYLKEKYPISYRELSASDVCKEGSFSRA